LEGDLVTKKKKGRGGRKKTHHQCRYQKVKRGKRRSWAGGWDYWQKVGGRGIDAQRGEYQQVYCAGDRKGKVSLTIIRQVRGGGVLKTGG